MARMIPPVVYNECTSPGERELFVRLRDDPGTDGWLVFHSLNLAHHKRQIQGELDFVIVVPGKGVLCLEVKSHRRIGRKNGLWHYGAASQQDVRGPFRQVSDGMHSLRKRLMGRAPELSSLVFWSGVVFTHSQFSEQSEEWHSWQVVDQYALRSAPISRLVNRILDCGRALLAQTASARWFDPLQTLPDGGQCELLLRLLRPDFEIFENPSVRLRRMDDEVKHFTEDQFIALDAMGDNKRVIFTGPAGTGKTILALEAARRSHSRGKRVLFLCYNHFLARWLEEQTTGLRNLVTMQTLHRYMLEIAGVIPAANATPSFWNHELPDGAIERLLSNAPLGFDEIIIDEAQDVLVQSFLDVLDLSVRGGLAAGCWRMFGDFEGQALYSQEADGGLGALDARAPGTARYTLRVNCRNTPRIAEWVYILGGLSPQYQKVLRPDDGVDPTIHYYSDADHQTSLLIQALDKLTAEGFGGDDIVVLSSRAVDACAPGLHTRPWSQRLRPFGQRNPGGVSYCTIHAYKGLEAKAVIVTDVDSIEDERARALFYVATTRALHRLVILADGSVKTQARSLIRKVLNTPELGMGHG